MENVKGKFTFFTGFLKKSYRADEVSGQMGNKAGDSVGVWEKAGQTPERSLGNC